MSLARCMHRALLGALFCWIPPSVAADALAPVEARVPFAPSALAGSDGARHLAYELHVTNIYADTGALKPQGLEVYADDATVPLARFSAVELATMTAPASAEPAPLSIQGGRRAVIHVWITLPAGTALPRTLRHRMAFATDKNGSERLDGARVTVNPALSPTLGPPLRGGQWLVHEGPGNAQSHHWGSLVAVNGAVTVPQRFAMDLVGVDGRGRAMRSGIAQPGKSRHTDWVGYGAEAIAVADGVVRDVRDGEEEHAPLTAQPEPSSLTAHGLLGNYVVLEIAPGVFATYAHLQRGSVNVRAGESVRLGQRLGRLGQSGNSAAPHLHFQIADAATFEGSEGMPFAFDGFDFLGKESEAQLFGQGEAWKPRPAERHRLQIPLDGDVVGFPAR